MRGWQQRLCAAALMSFLALLWTGGRTALAADGLETRVVSNYEVDDQGGVHVRLSATVTNNDPSTARRSTGRVFFYSATGFLIHDLANNLVARSGGTRLVVELRERNDPLRVIAVRFPRDLYYGETLDLTLDYDLAPPIRAEQLVLTGDYAFLPALAQGTEALTLLSAPAGRQVAVSSSVCTRVSDQPRVNYRCGGVPAAEMADGARCAFTVEQPRWECALDGTEPVVIPFEAGVPTPSLGSRTASTALGERQIAITVRHFRGEEAWADNVALLVQRGMSALQQALGFAYPGPPNIEIIESGYRDTHGYQGLASSNGRIRLTPVVDDQTVLHEVAHLWSGVFTSRWLAEGIADYAANQAALKLGLRPEAARTNVPPLPRLEDWGPLRNQIAVSDEERAIEDAGYARSLRFIEILAQRTSPERLAEANAVLAKRRIPGTARSYLDALEEVSGVSLAPLFGEWALTEADAALLPQRAETRARVETLRQSAAAISAGLPADIEAGLRAWDFARVERAATVAELALAQHQQNQASAAEQGLQIGDVFARAWTQGTDFANVTARDEAAAIEALARMEERQAREPGVAARVGLWGWDVDTRAATARTALEAGDYVESERLAREVEQRLSRAPLDGALRITLSGGLLLVIALFLWLLLPRRGRRGADVPTSWDAA